MGALAVPLTISTVLLPSILLALGCAYTMHLLTAAAGRGGGEELRRALPEVALPIALSGLTTAVGFVAVSFVRIETIQYVGAFGALGVLVVLGATLTVAPAALRLWPLPERRLRLRKWFCGPAARGVVAFVAARRPVVIAGWLLALIGVGIGILRLQVETDVIVWFSRDDPVRVAYEEIRSRLSGISPMNVVIEAPEGGAVSVPEVLRAVDGLSSHLESLPEVGRAVSIADPLRQMHGGFLENPDNPLPQGPDLISQYLLLLEAKDYTYDLITADRSSANVRLRIDNNGSKALLGVAEEARGWWADHGVSGYAARTTGIMYEFARAEDEIATGQLRGLGFALLAIALILLAIFRSPRLAAMALLPNAIPIAMAFGVMGLLDVPLDAGTVVLGNLALGIAVDDTIHVVTGFYGRREGGDAAGPALLGAFERTLAPVVYTTLAVAIGFAILGLSEFTFTRHLGLLTAGIMGLCLLGNVLLLPALLLGMGPRKKDEAAGGGRGYQQSQPGAKPRLKSDA
jgi:predicted RND superfamily exporter protein